MGKQTMRYSQNVVLHSMENKQCNCMHNNIDGTQNVMLNDETSADEHTQLFKHFTHVKEFSSQNSIIDCVHLLTHWGEAKLGPLGPSRSSREDAPSKR